MKFTDLPIDHRIIKNLDAMQLSDLTDIQQQAIPHALLNKDILASSKTGSGKTLAFVVPMVNRLLSTRALSKADPRALILAPTRELAKQVFGVCRQVIVNTQLRASLVVGGENYNDQVNVLRRKPQIIVATAGRIADHLSDRHLFLNGLELLILDEADRMLELGFSTQLAAIHGQADHRKRQTMMFSATIEQAQIKQMTKELLNKPQKIVIDSNDQPHKDILQKFYLSDGVRQKDQQLIKLINIVKREQAIVFTATREDTVRLQTMLYEQQFDAIALHGELLQKQRNQVLQDFGNGKYGVLVTTDLGARGLDIRNVSLVLNYDLPKFPEEYIHRIGRTGRAGDKGTAISLVGKKDWRSFEAIKANYVGEVTFETLADIKTVFTGQKAKVEKTTIRPSKAKHTLNNETKPERSKRRFKPLESVESGDLPIKRKPRRAPDEGLIDDELDDHDLSQSDIKSEEKKNE